MNICSIIILVILIGEYVLSLFVEYLNLSNICGVLPEEFEGYLDTIKYKKAQDYLKDKTIFGLLKGAFFMLVTVFFIFAGGFNLVDQFAISFGFGFILTGIIFSGVLLLFYQIITIPFAIYHTFVIEDKYGFNKTSVKTFILDILKSWFLVALLGSVVFSAILYFFYKTGNFAWIYCWIAVVLFELFLVFIAPVVIMPIFNKFIPLEDGELKNSIQAYANQENFKISGIFKIDASRRSTKTNAFFTGFGRFRRIALFDTLIQRHSVNELVSVLAHEIGHFKNKHFIKRLVISIATTGIMFFILSFFIGNQGLFKAFKMKEISIYASLVFFSFIYSPVHIVFAVFENFISRRQEFEADRFAVLTYKKKDDFIAALKKLSTDNLSNLAPHSLKVFFDYSHPPVLERIKAIRQLIQ